MLVNDVFCVVSLNGTTRSAISVLLEEAASVVFLVLMAVIISMAKSSSAARTILARKLLVNTCFATKDAVVRGVVSVMCVDVGNTCCFVTHSIAVKFFSKTGPTLKMFMLVLGPFLQTTIPGQKKFSMPKTKGNRRAKNAKRTSASRYVVEITQRQRAFQWQPTDNEIS